MTWQPDPARTFVGLAASHARWPPARYRFIRPPSALPMHVDHTRHVYASHGGEVDATVGWAREFREVDGQGLAVLAEVDSPALMWQVDERRLSLSIGYCLDPQPGGPTLLYLSEVSLTGRPGDPGARILSSGKLALRDWELITGQPLPRRPAAALA